MAKKTLSKSKLMAYRQCPRRLWLEVRRPELREDSASSKARFEAGHEVGDIARQIYDPQARGVLLDLDVLGVESAIRQTEALLAERVPIFEAGFASRPGCRGLRRFDAKVGFDCLDSGQVVEVFAQICAVFRVDPTAASRARLGHLACLSVGDIATVARQTKPGQATADCLAELLEREHSYKMQWMRM